MIAKVVKRASAGVVMACFALRLQAVPARADATDLARADTLFAAAKERFARGDYEGACRDFEESARLEPATGALLALAMCHERQGRLATASREYNEVLVRSEVEARADRAKLASARIAALDARLSTVTVSLAQANTPAGFQVRVGSQTLAPDELRKAIPVDGGLVRVEASAHGMETFQQDLSVADSQDHLTLIIPELVAVQAEIPFIRPALFFQDPAPTARTEPKRPWLNDVRWMGVGVMGLGVIGVGAAAALTAHAGDKQREEARCEQGECSTDGPRSPYEASDARRAASIAFAMSGAALGLGIGLLIWGGPQQAFEVPTRVAVAPWLIPGQAGAMVDAKF